jgi:hypothetical protein
MMNWIRNTRTGGKNAYTFSRTPGSQKGKELDRLAWEDK